MQKEVFSRVLWAWPGVLLMLAYSQENLICPFKFMLEFSMCILDCKSLRMYLYSYLPFKFYIIHIVLAAQEVW